MAMSVSVVIPALNAAATIDETIRSLVAQKFKAWEAIIVDDGSTDTTPDRARDWLSRDARVRYIRQENQGASAARNAGIAIATFDWLLFLDADDWIHPKHLHWLTRKLRSDPTLDIVYGGWGTYVIRKRSSS